MIDAISARKAEHGFALVSVLWAMALLSLIATAMISSSALSYRMERNALERTLTENAFEAALVGAVAGLVDSRLDQRWRIDGISQEFVFNSRRIRVYVQDVLGLIDLNTADVTLLAALLRSTGMTEDQATSLADRIIDWRIAGQLHSLNGDIKEGDRSYHPRGAPFQSVDELKLVPGITRTLFARIRPAITIYSGQSRIDPRVAPKEALLALPNLNEREVDEIIARRLSPNSKGETDPAASLNSRVFAIRLELSRRGVVQEKEAVVRITGDMSHPYMVLALEDRP